MCVWYMYVYILTHTHTHTHNTHTHTHTYTNKYRGHNNTLEIHLTDGNPLLLVCGGLVAPILLLY